MKGPSLRVVIGTDAYKAVIRKLESYRENYKKYEKILNNTDVEGYKAPQVVPMTLWTERRGRDTNI